MKNILRHLNLFKFQISSVLGKYITVFFINVNVLHKLYLLLVYIHHTSDNIVLDLEVIEYNRYKYVFILYYKH